MNRDELMTAARKHAKLAMIYAEDGAFATGAKLLHETAQMFEKEHQRIQDILTPATKKGGNVMTGAKKAR